MSENEKTFTEALAGLQKAATDIGRQTTTLEDAIKLFEDGMKQAELCTKILDEAKQKIEIYTDNQE